MCRNSAYRDVGASTGFKTERINNMSQLSNYKLKYHNFIDKRRHRPLKAEKGYEIHHIIPRSLGGSNKKDNLVKLSYREHWMAHRFLTKVYTGTKKQKMYLALWYLSNNRNILNSRQYENIKKKLRKSQINTTKSTWANHTSDEYHKRCKASSNGLKDWWSNLSDKDRQRISESRSASVKKVWQEGKRKPMSYETKKKIAEKIKLRWKEKGDAYRSRSGAIPKKF